jgi:serine/threonine protein kinase
MGAKFSRCVREICGYYDLKCSVENTKSCIVTYDTFKKVFANEEDKQCIDKIVLYSETKLDNKPSVRLENYNSKPVLYKTVFDKSDADFAPIMEQIFNQYLIFKEFTKSNKKTNSDFGTVNIHNQTISNDIAQGKRNLYFETEIRNIYKIVNALKEDVNKVYYPIKYNNIPFYGFEIVLNDKININALGNDNVTQRVENIRCIPMYYCESLITNPSVEDSIQILNGLQTSILPMLETLHMNNIVHRSITHKNIMKCNGTYCLTGYDSAADESDETLLQSNPNPSYYFFRLMDGNTGSSPSVYTVIVNSILDLQSTNVDINNLEGVVKALNIKYIDFWKLYDKACLHYITSLLHKDVKTDANTQMFMKKLDFNENLNILRRNPSQLGGLNKMQKTDERIMYKGRQRVVYKGKRGVKYVKLDGEMVHVSRLKKKNTK